MSSNIYERIGIYCEKHRLFQKNNRVLVGLSGGADSVFLLYALKKLQSKWNLILHAVHINHGIRGVEALRDEKYAVEFAKSLGIECTVFRADIPSIAKREKRTEEEAGRIYRYQSFEELRQKLGYDLIAVAHHREDQAETVLFQMLRGSSLRGLGGMRPKRDNIVRPLLEIGRGEIESELCQNEITFCNDSTNEQDAYSRNLLRRHVIPYLQENVQPAATAHIAQSAEDLQEVMQYLDVQTDEMYRRFVKEQEACVKVSYEDFKTLYPVLQRELVLRMIEKVSGKKKDITRKHIHAVCELYMGKTGKSLTLPYSLKAEKSYGDLLLSVDVKQDDKLENEKQEVQVEWNYPYLLKLEDGKEYNVFFEKRDRENLSDNSFKKNCTKCFDYDRMCKMPILRCPMEGDYLWLDRMGRKKKLSRLFIDEKIPLNQRKETWILAEGNHVLWIPALNRVSAYYYVTNNTQKVICASIK